MIAIVGGGASGLLVAAQLRRRFPRAAYTVFEAGELGGIAYSSCDASHLLNVRAGRMSAWADRPDDFAQWAQVPGDVFAPRQLYGRYLKSLIDPKVIDQVKVEHVHAHGLTLHDGRTIRARSIVLALGHQSESGPGHPAWQPLPNEAFNAETVVILGTGLTCVDVLLTLHARGFRGQVHAVSRHGWLPQTHEHHAVAARAFAAEAPFTSTRALMRAMRAHAATGSWQSGVDGIRPLIPQLWSALPLPEKRRFERHAGTLWEIHRHRLAPELNTVVERWLHEGRLRVHAGHLIERSATHVQFRRRGTNQTHTLHGSVINALGPASVQHPLIEQLIEQGLARAGPLGLGVCTDADGAMLDAQGTPSQRVFTLGPLRRGDLWETTAIAEIREQAERLAQRLAAQTELA